MVKNGSTIQRNRVWAVEGGCWNGMKQSKPPKFTEDELKAIHRELVHAPWQSDVLYDERKAVIRKLDQFFGGKRYHLIAQSR